jgi:hypothetical protein
VATRRKDLLQQEIEALRIDLGLIKAMEGIGLAVVQVDLLNGSIPVTIAIGVSTVGDAIKDACSLIQQSIEAELQKEPTSES